MRLRALAAVAVALALLAWDVRGQVGPFKWWQIDGTQSARVFYPRDDTSHIGAVDSPWAVAYIETIHGRIDTALVALFADSASAAAYADSAGLAGHATLADSAVVAVMAYLADSSAVAGFADSAAVAALADSAPYSYHADEADSAAVAAFADSSNVTNHATSADSAGDAASADIVVVAVQATDSSWIDDDLTITGDLDVDGMTEVDSLHASLGITVDGGAVIDDSTHVDDDLTCDAAGIGEAADSDALSVGGTTDTDSLFVSGDVAVAGDLSADHITATDVTSDAFILESARRFLVWPGQQAVRDATESLMYTYGPAAAAAWFLTPSTTAARTWLFAVSPMIPRHCELDSLVITYTANDVGDTLYDMAVHRQCRVPTATITRGSALTTSNAATGTIDSVSIVPYNTTVSPDSLMVLSISTACDDGSTHLKIYSIEAVVEDAAD